MVFMSHRDRRRTSPLRTHPSYPRSRWMIRPTVCVANMGRTKHSKAEVMMDAKMRKCENWRLGCPSLEAHWQSYPWMPTIERCGDLTQLFTALLLLE